MKEPASSLFEHHMNSKSNPYDGFVINTCYVETLKIHIKKMLLFPFYTPTYSGILTYIYRIYIYVSFRSKMHPMAVVSWVISVLPNVRGHAFQIVSSLPW
jgi:hypothetical protein